MSDKFSSLFIAGPEYGPHIPSSLSIAEINNLPRRDEYRGNFSVRLFYGATASSRPTMEPNTPSASQPPSASNRTSNVINIREANATGNIATTSEASHFDFLAGRSQYHRYQTKENITILEIAQAIDADPSFEQTPSQLQ